MNESTLLEQSGREAGGPRAGRRPPGPNCEPLEPRILLSGPVVTSFDPEGTTHDAFQDLAMNLSAPVVGGDARDAGTYVVTHLGGDGAVGGGDDRRASALPQYRDGAAQIRLAPTADLGQWDEADYFLDLGMLGEWHVENGGSNARQALDGGATFLVSATDVIDEAFTGTLRVDDPDGDDDFIGVVFGFQADEQTNRPASYYLLSWKAAAQGPAEKGIKLLKVTGTGQSGQTPDLWDLESTDPRLEVLAGDEAVGWEAGTGYEFAVEYGSDGQIDVTVARADDGSQLWHYEGTDADPLGAGKAGFYNLSQAGATYAARTAGTGWEDGVYELRAVSGDPGLRGLDDTALDGNGDGTPGDDYAVTFGVDAQVPQIRIALADGYDTGMSDADGITNIAALTYEVTVNEAGLLGLDLDGNGTRETSLSAPTGGTYAVAAAPLADGEYTIAADFTPAGGELLTDQIAVTVDTTAPTLLAGEPVAAAPVAQRVLRFGEAIDPGTLAAGDVLLSGPGIPEPLPVTGLTGATDTFTAAFDALTTRDRFTLTVAASVSDLAGNPLNQDGDAAPGEVGQDEGIDAFLVLVDPAWLDIETTIDAGDTTRDGDDLVVDGATVTIDGEHSFYSVWVINAGVVTHSASAAAGLSLTVAEDMLVEAGSVVSADGRGLSAAGEGGSGEGVGGGGGGHGGAGGDGLGGAGGGTYGSELEPSEAGSPGGRDLALAGAGGLGGGAVRLVVSGTLTVDGRISADGAVGDNAHAGGGSGGSVWVTTGVLTGTGWLEADGADGVGNGGGGGGGRIAVYATDADAFDEARATAEAGTGHNEGQPGTVHWGTLDPGAIALELHPDSDSGVSDSDLLTNDDTPTFVVTVLQAGTLSVDFDEDAQPEFEEAVTAGVYEYTSPAALADGLRTVSAALAVPLIGSVSKSVTIEVDTTAPSLRPGPGTAQAPFFTRTLEFTEAIDPATLTLGDLTLTGPGGVLAGVLVALDGDGTEYTVSFDADSPLNEGGPYGIDLGSRIADPAGNPAGLPVQDTFQLLPDVVKPAVVGFSPVGFLNAAVSRLTVEFSEEIKDGTFAADDVAISGPAGAVDPAGITVKRTGPQEFEVLIPEQAQEGTYDVTIGPDVTDLVGNPMLLAYRGSFVIDTTGPRVEEMTPSGTVNAPVGSVTVLFDSAVGSGTFQVADAALDGPTGPVSIHRIRRINDREYRVEFAGQRANGVYTLTVGPGVQDQAGNAMNQDGDDVNGEADVDAFTGSFTVALADLLVAEGEPGDVPDAADQGETIHVQWTVQNTGDAAAVGDWVDRVWLSADDQMDGGDLLLGEVAALLTPLPAGTGQYSTGADVTLPLDVSLPDGTYHILVETDASDVVAESDEMNNAASVGSFAMTLPQLPDLTVQDVAGPDEAMPGASVEVTWTLANDGFFEADGTWTESIYLSSDAAVGDDRLIAEVSYGGSVPVGGSVERSATIAVPDTVSGDVWLVVRTNSEGEVFELDPDNNTDVAAAPTTVWGVLSLSVSADEVAEDAANPAIRGTVTRSGPVTDPLLVTLASDNTGELTVPGSVTIPAGHRAAEFDVSVVADGVTDGPQAVWLSADADGFFDDIVEVYVLDVDTPLLTLELSAETVAEGGAVTATVTRDFVSIQPVNVLIDAGGAIFSGCTSCGNDLQIDMPLSVVIGSDDAAATFEIIVPDDELVELTRTYDITVSASGYTDGGATLHVEDNDVPNLVLELAADAVSEGAGAMAVTATVTRDLVSGLDLVVALFSSDETAALVPATVTIPAGEASASFAIDAVDDAAVDGGQLVTVRAEPLCYLGKLCGQGQAEADLLVSDDDGPTLTVAIDRDLAAEGLTDAATVTVSRNTDTTGALEVTLESGNTDELTVPESVTIPAGEASVSFGADTVEDGVADGNRTVSVTASADGFTSGSDTIVVTDVDLPDLLVTRLEAPPAVLTEAYFDVTYRVGNLGLAEAVGSDAEGDFPGSWTQQVFLSDDPYVGEDLLVGTYEFTGTMPEGQYFQRTIPVRAPLAAGTYWVIVSTDVLDTVGEGLETNNTAVGAEPIEIEAAYSATVSTSVEVALAGTPVPLSGRAVKAGTGEPAPFALVSIHLNVRGTKRVIAAFTDDAGEFSTTFYPLPGEAGQYTVGAAHPGEGDAPVQDAFTLLGMRAEPPEAAVTVIEGADPLAGQITVRNLADVPLTGLAVQSLDAPGNLEVTVSLGGADTLEALGELAVSYEIAATDASVTETAFTIRVTSAEGASVDVPVAVHVESLRPRLVGNVQELRAAMRRGEQTFVEFTVTNEGGSSTGPLRVGLPASATAWMSAATAEDVAPLAPGESTVVTLRLFPPADMELTQYTGTLGLVGDNAFFSIPYAFRAVSDAEGDLSVLVVDEMFYFTQEAPPVAEATIVLRDAISGEQVAAGATDADGLFLAEDLLEGYYTLEVRDDDHEGYRGTVFVAGDTLNSELVFVSRHAVKYVWSVEEIVIEDRTKITVESVFETNVPLPVVTIDNPIIDLADLKVLGQTMQVDMTVTNHGLIAAQDTRFFFGSHPYYSIEPLIDYIGVLPAKSSLTVPITVTRIGVPEEPTAPEAPAGEGDQPAGVDPVACHIAAGLLYAVICGPWEAGKQVPIEVANVDGSCDWLPRVFPTAAETGPGGEPFRGSNESFDSENPCKCDPNTFKKREIATVDLLGPLGSALGAAQNLVNLTMGMQYGIAPQLALEGKVGLRTCCKPDGTPGIEWFGKAGATGGLQLGRGLNFSVGADWKIFSATATIKSGEMVTPEVFLNGEVSSNCDGPQKTTVNGGVRVNYFKGLSGKVDVDAGLGPVKVPLLTGSGLRGQETTMFNYSFTDTSTTGGPTTEQVAAEIEEILERCADDPAEFLRAMEDLPGSFNWNYFSTGLEFTAAFEYGGEVYSFSDNPDTPEVETWGYLVEPYAKLGSNVGSDNAMVPWTEEEAADEGVFDEGMDDLLDKVPDEEEPPPEEPAGCSTQPSGGAEEGICATVRLSLDQEAVMTRTAFRAGLDLINNSPNPLEGVRIDVQVTDEDANPVNDLFGIEPPALDGLTAVDGTGVVEQGRTGSASWVIIPTDEAAPEQATRYWVGGVLSYVDDGLRVTVPLESMPITVQPDAALDLRYFHQRDVFSDDPFTEEVEPAQPFALAILVQNHGAGAARDLQITSAQPEIVDNEKGLLIDFKILATEVAGQNMTPSLTADFGDVEPGEIKIGQWWLTSTLQGLFIDYDATFEHVNDLGDPRLSLIKNVEIHELIHSVRAYGALADGLPDFLVNDASDPDDLPDTLYLSDGSVALVGLAGAAAVDGPVTPHDLEVELTVEMADGWSYLRTPDPGGSDYRLVSVRRADGTELPGENFWQTDRTFIGGGKRPIVEDNLHLLDLDGTATYTLVYQARDQVAPTITELEQFGDEPLTEPVAAAEVTFSEEVDPASFDRADVTLTRSGGPDLIGAGVTIAHVEGTTYRINGLSGLTEDDGEYVLTVYAMGVTDRFNNAGTGAASSSWTKALDAPGVAQIAGVPSAFRNEPVGAVDVTFTEPIQVATLGLEDLTLTRDGGDDLISAGVTITQTAERIYRIDGLDALTGEEGLYVLTVDAAGVEDPEGNAGVGRASVAWTMDTTVPAVDSAGELPDPTNTPVDAVDVTLSEAIDAASFDHADVTLTRGGGGNLIDEGVTVEHVEGTTYRIAGLGELTVEEGAYELTVDGGGLADRAGNAGTGSAAVSWLMDTTPPAAPDGLTVHPDTGAATNDGLTNTADVTIAGRLGEGGLRVTLHDETTGEDVGEAEVIGTAFSLDVAFASPGSHRIGVTATDAAGNAAEGPFEVFVDLAEPTISSLAGLPDAPSPSPVSSLDVVFSEPIDPATFDASDLALTRDGGEDLIDAGVTVAHVSGAAWRIDGLGELTGESGRYELTIDLTGLADLAGNAGSAPFAAAWVADTTPPQVVAFQRNDGTDIWSEIGALAVTFSEDVAVVPAALTMQSRTTGGHVDLTAASFDYDDENHVARWDLSGVALPHDDYLVRLAAADAADAAGNHLDGDDDGEAGGDYRTTCLLTFPGDTDLDGDVDRADFLTLSSHFGITSGMTWADGDFDANGAVDYEDFLALRAYTGSRLRLDRTTVTIVELNDGEGRRFEATAIDFVFSRPVTVEYPALALYNDSTGQPVAMPPDLPFSRGADMYSARWGLGDLGLSLGRYTATLTADHVVDEDGDPLDGDEDGTAGGDFRYSFVVTFPGDSDSDGEVDYLDYMAVKRHIGTASGAGWEQGDFDDDRDVDRDDFLAVRARFGASVDSPGASPADGGADDARRAGEDVASDGGEALPPVDCLGGAAAASPAGASAGGDEPESPGPGLVPAAADVLGAAPAGTTPNPRAEPAPSLQPPDTTGDEGAPPALGEGLLDVLALPELRPLTAGAGA